jgi:hypothetical protein
MEPINTNDENSFDPTPRLKSSPIPIKFISFNQNDKNCVYCGEEYINTLLCSDQRYCKKCLLRYINDLTDNNKYLDVYIYTMDLECREHEISRTRVPQSIQECCGNCLKILCFKQIIGWFRSYGLDKNNLTIYNKVIESEKDCKLCGKSLFQGTYEVNYSQLKLCSDCYLISSEWMESTLIKKKQISIFYLPWWHDLTRCDACYSTLIFTSDCQKYCANCLIFYTGCRYCLTTNIIVGPIVQSQCKKCKRISIIINSELIVGLDEFLLNDVIHNYFELADFANITKAICKYFVPEGILNCFFKKRSNIKLVRWIPFSQFTDVKEMTKGGYGIIYKATWLNKNETVILKRFENSKNMNQYFLNEVNILYLNIFLIIHVKLIES